MKTLELRSRLNIQAFATYTSSSPNPNTQTTGTATLSGEMKTYYNKTLIDLAEPELVHDQFADKYPIPANGGKTIEFRQYDSLAKALTPLTEGVTPDGNNLSMHTLTATVSQYGDYITLSDVLKVTAIDNNVVQSLEVLGSQAGRTLDTISRDALAGGTNVIYAGGATDRDKLTSADTLKPVYFFMAAAQLKAMNAPTINGSYVAIIHPYAAFDLMTSQEWIDVNKYAHAEKIFEGEIGKIGNVRFVEATEAKVWCDNTCPVNASADSGYDAVFGTLVLGAKAYGTTDIEGLGMETIIKQLGSAGTADPLNQRSTVGWKASKVTKRLVEQYMIRIESVSQYSSVTTAN